MAMVESRAQELADQARALKKRVIRVVSRDGVIDDEELEVLQALNELEHSYQEKAEDEAFGVAMMRRGRNSDRVVRLGRQMFGSSDGPEAA